MIRRIPLRLCCGRLAYRNLPHLRISQIHIVSRKPNPPPAQEEDTATAHSIRDKIWGFIRRESLALKHSLEDDLLESQMQRTTIKQMVAELDPFIQKELEKQTDAYNRFLTLLTFHPILVRPAVYYRFENELQAPLQETTKNLYIKRLVYHQQFQKCWQILLEDTNGSTITDLEDYLSLVLSELQINNNMQIGLRSFILNGFEIIQSPGLLATTMDFICYRINISREELHQNYNYYLEMQTIDSVLDLEKHIRNRESSSLFESLLQSKRRLQLTTDHSSIPQLFYHWSKLFKNSPGWISFLLLDQPLNALPYKNSSVSIVNSEFSNFNLVKLVPSMKGLKLNDYDFLHVLQTTTPENAFSVFLSYRRSNKEPKRWNKYLVDHLAKLVLQHGMVDEISRVSLDACPVLDGKVLSDNLLFMWNTRSLVQFQKIIKRIQKRGDPYVFHFVFLRLQPKTIEDCDSIIRSFYRTSVSNKVASAIISQVHLINDTSRTCFYNKLLKDFNFSSYTLVELFRSYIIRDNGRDSVLIGPLFETILSKSFSKDIILSRNVKLDNQLSDFQSLLKYSTKVEKARFHNRIRALAQSISLLDPEDIAQVCNIIQSKIREQQFRVCEAKHGKKYILNCLVYDIMRFIDRKNPGMKALGVIKRINAGFPSYVCSGYMYKIVARENPLVAIKTFTESQNKEQSKVFTKSLLRFIASGLLESPALSNKQKLLYFEEFKKSVEAMGQKFPLSLFLKAKLVKLILYISREEEIRPFVDTKKEVRFVVKNYGIPSKVLKGLTKDL